MDSEQKQFIVTGMPRSGTSLVIGMCRILGVNLGEEEDIDTRINEEFHPTATLQDLAISDFNDLLLKRDGDAGGMFDPPNRIEIAPITKIDLQKLILGKIGTKKLWGVKDPRIILLLPLYAEIMPKPYFIFVMRKWDNLAKALIRYYPEVNLEKMYTLYRGYLANIKKIEKKYPTYFIFFKRIIKDSIQEAHLLADFIDVPLNEEKKKLIKDFVIRKNHA